MSKNASSACAVHIPVSVGELVDKLTILDIKAERITQLQALVHVRHERALLAQVLQDLQPLLPSGTWLAELSAKLKTVNERLWGLEDAVRAHERQGRFDDVFIAHARAIYAGNDERASIKRAINQHAGSDIIEVKSHSTS